MEKTELDLDEYLASLPAASREDIVAVDAAITAAMAGEEKYLSVGKFWGGTDQRIIGYGEWSYIRSDKQKVEWFLIGLALQKNYISVYINGVEDGQYLSEKYGKAIGKVKVGKSSISFKSLDDIDLDKLMALVARTRELHAGSG